MFCEELPNDIFSPTDHTGMLPWNDAVLFCNNLSNIGTDHKRINLIQMDCDSPYPLNLAVALAITVGVKQIGLQLSPEREQQVIKILKHLDLNTDKFNRSDNESLFIIDIVEVKSSNNNPQINPDTNLVIVKTEDPHKYKEILVSKLPQYKISVSPKYKLIFCERQIPHVKPKDNIINYDIPYKITVDSSNNYPFIDEAEWKINLISFLTKLSVQIWGKDNIFIAHKGFEEPHLRIWCKAFTHESYNRGPGNNYETLEYVGDKLMSSAFAVYLFKMNNNILNNQLNSLNVFYLSKVRQHNMSQYLQLTKMARTFYDYGINLSEDLIESFFGAIHVVADNIAGMGDSMVSQLIHYLFKDIKIELTGSQSSPILDLNELFQLYGWGLIGDENSRSKRNKHVDIFNNNIITNMLANGKRETCLIVSNQVLEAISIKEGLTFSQISNLYPNNCLVRIENDSNKLPNEELAEKALQILDGYDINRKLNTKSTRIQVEADYKIALKKAISEGYTDLYFPKISGNSSTYYIQLVGIKTITDEGKAREHYDILITVKMSYKDNPSNILKPIALKLYIKSGKQVLPYTVTAN